MKKLVLILSVVAVVTLAGAYFILFAKNTQTNSGETVNSLPSYGNVLNHEAHHR